MAALIETDSEIEARNEVLTEHLIASSNNKICRNETKIFLSTLKKVMFVLCLCHLQNLSFKICFSSIARDGCIQDQFREQQFSVYKIMPYLPHSYV